jgi:F0F1-type ATP synthase membrane subunit c/vacuolar-type H+-ATPase subunit K
VTVTVIVGIVCVLAGAGVGFLAAALCMAASRADRLPKRDAA